MAAGCRRAAVWAEPRFAAESGYSCNLCHVDPAGGGLRTDYGLVYFGADELPLVNGRKHTLPEWDGLIDEQVRMGGDFRVQYLNYHGDENRQGRIFPMQADIYSQIIINSMAELYFSFNLNG